MKNLFKILVVLLIVPFIGNAQENEETAQSADTEKVDKLERAAFESSYIIDNQTNVLLNENALEVMMQHRFGPFNGTENGWGRFLRSLGSSQHQTWGLLWYS